MHRANLTYNTTTVAGVANKIISVTFESISVSAPAPATMNKGEILASILGKHGNCYFFLHNTRDENIASVISEEGFLFENQLPHSTDMVNPQEPVEVSYFLLQRREYGQFTVVLAISRDTFDSYVATAEANKTGIEELLTATPPYYGDNEELIYRIPNKYVLGYFDNLTLEFHYNKHWDPDYSINAFTAQKQFKS